jgi:hypothetical protein
MALFPHNNHTGMVGTRMALRQQYTLVAEIPESLREHYTEKDGRFVLQTDPPSEDVSGLKTALESERRLKREAEAALSGLKTRFEGIDPTDVAELRARVESVKDKEIYDKEGLETLVNRRTQQLRDDHARVLAAKEREASQLKDAAIQSDQKWRKDRIKTHLLAAATAAGVDADAVTAAVMLGEEVFLDLDDKGNLLAKSGEDVQYGKDGISPLQPREWFLSIRPTHKFLWPPSAGSGASPQHSGTGTSVDYSKISSPAERLTAYRQAKTSGERGG